MALGTPMPPTKGRPLMAKIIHVYGLVRSAEKAVKRGTTEVYGAHIGILTEPAGDTIRVTAFDRTLSAEAALALLGTEVHAIVGQEQRGNFTDSNLISVEPWQSPVVGSAGAYVAADGEGVAA